VNTFQDIIDNFMCNLSTELDCNQSDEAILQALVDLKESLKLAYEINDKYAQKILELTKED